MAEEKEIKQHPCGEVIDKPSPLLCKWCMRFECELNTNKSKIRK